MVSTCRYSCTAVSSSFQARINSVARKYLPELPPTINRMTLIHCNEPQSPAKSILLEIWQSVLWDGFCYGSRCYGMASAMTVGAMEWLLLWLPLPEIWQSVLWNGFCYGNRCYEVASTMATAAWNLAVGAMEWLLLWLPLPEIWHSVLWLSSVMKSITIVKDTENDTRSPSSTSVTSSSSTRLSIPHFKFLAGWAPPAIAGKDARPVSLCAVAGRLGRSFGGGRSVRLVGYGLFMLGLLVFGRCGTDVDIE